ncbi:M1 family aminopeptidase [Candidatus Bipolaricaulota bacterium]
MSKPRRALTSPSRRCATCTFAAILLLVLVLVLGLAVAAVPQYEIELSVDWNSGTFTGIAQVTVENSAEEPIDEVIFRLFPNDNSLYGNASIRVTDATLAGEPVELRTHADPTVLPIALPMPLDAAQTASLVLRFEGIAGTSPLHANYDVTGYGILTKNPRSLVLTAFYPILAVLDSNGWSLDPPCGIGDALWSIASDYTLTLSAPDTLAPVSSGRHVSSQRENGLAVHHFAADSARDFSLVLTLGYEEAELQSGSKTLRTWFTPPSRAAAERTLLTASAALSMYESLIGPLPQDEIDFVEVPLHRAAGVEFSGLILIASAYTPRPFDTFYDIIVSHEMAHQWFYDAVGSNPAKHPWLDEGLATYLSNVFLEAARGEEIAGAEVRRWQDAYAASQTTHPDLAISDPACGFPESSIYSTFVYSAAAWFHHSVRHEIGEDAFFDALSGYYFANVGRIGTPEELIAAFQDACTCDLSDLFHAFGLAPE